MTAEEKSFRAYCIKTVKDFSVFMHSWLVFGYAISLLAALLLSDSKCNTFFCLQSKQKGQHDGNKELQTFM